MTQNNPDQKGEKFFFHLNVFDDGYDADKKDAPDEPPPPPTFSEDELNAAKQIAFNEGRKIEAQENQKSREKYIAGQIDLIAQNILALHSAEDAREKLYEREAVNLTLAIFEKIFPMLLQQNGLVELKNIISTVLQNQENHKKLTIFVHPVDVQDISKHMETLRAKGLATDIDVQGDAALNSGACRIAWADGGAVCNPMQLAEEIKQSLQQVLAGRAATSHDEG